MQENEGHHNLQEVNCFFSIFLSKSYDFDAVSRGIISPKLVYWYSHSRVVLGVVTTQDLLTSIEGSETQKKCIPVFHFVV